MRRSKEGRGSDWEMVTLTPRIMCPAKGSIYQARQGHSAMEFFGDIIFGLWTILDMVNGHLGGEKNGIGRMYKQTVLIEIATDGVVDSHHAVPPHPKTPLSMIGLPFAMFPPCDPRCRDADADADSDADCMQTK